VHVEHADALERARDAAAAHHPVELRTVFGRATHRLLDEIAVTEATLAVVGAGPRSRTAGALVGSVATHLVHEAPCSVLVVRDAADTSTFPREIVVRDDGSVAAERAVEVATALRDRFGARLRTLVDDGDDAVGALVDASETADLVVVGSRGRRGLKALGSVSERVAHAARCSVLVAR
jgi:nucleotide-binding universal stress UspA family protein